MANRMQHVHNAIRRMRAEGEAWVTHEGERLRIRPLRPEEREWRPVAAVEGRPEGVLPHATPQGGGWFPQYRAVVRTRARGGVAFAEVWWHEGRLHTDTGVSVRRGNDDVVLAIVAESHPYRSEP